MKISIQIEAEPSELYGILTRLGLYPIYPPQASPQPSTAVAVTPEEPVTPKKGGRPPKRGAGQDPELEFDAFDQLARKEMLRLSIDKRMPNHRLWESERDQRLPTMVGVMQRYQVRSVEELAKLMNLQPPLGAKRGGDEG